VQENARRIFSTSGVTLKKHRGKVPFTDGIADVAFRNPDGSDVLVTYNTSGSPIRFGVNDSERGWFTVKVPPHATTTFTWS
jgi:O-glycosyl hydrolase